MKTPLLGIAAALVLATNTLPFESAAADPSPRTDSVIFFAADGMHQDLVKQYATNGFLPAMNALLGTQVWAPNGGLRTQAPATSGAGWHTLATGAWAGVHGATNDIFHIHGQPFLNRTSAFAPGVLQAETLAQSAERGGRRVAQIEWAGGAVGQIDGPTVDFRTFLSGRGVATNYISPRDLASEVAALGLQFDHPAGFAGQPPFPGAAPSPATGWTTVPASFSPAMEMRLRVLDAGVDKYGLYAYLYDSVDDGITRYDRVLFSRTKSGSDSVGDLPAGGWADVKVLIIGGALNGLTAGFLVKVETLSPDLANVRLFHTPVTRAIASWPGWPGEPGFTGDFAEYVAQTFPTSTSADFAVLQAGIVSEDTYAEQGLYWKTGHHPLIQYIVELYQPELLMVGYPVTQEFSGRFLGLVTRNLPDGSLNPSFDDEQANGTPDFRVNARVKLLRSGYQGADATLALLQSLMPGDTTSFVASDHGMAPQFLAIDASKLLVDLGLLSRPQTSNCRPATGETIGKAKACWAGGALQIYLNLAGRDPAGGGFQQVPQADYAATVASIRAALGALVDPNDWSGDGLPEGWKLIDRSYGAAEARYVQNGGGSNSADMAYPTRVGDVVALAYPPYQFDGATPGTLVARSASFGASGYAPNLRVQGTNTNLRGAFFAGGRGLLKNITCNLRSIDLAPTIAYLLRVPEPQHSQGRVALDCMRATQVIKLMPVIHLTDFHGQLDPTTLLLDGRPVPAGGAAQLATLFDEEIAQLHPDTLLLASGDNVGASPPNSALLDDRPAIEVANTWGMDGTAYGNHEFDYGLLRLLAHQLHAAFAFLGANIVDTVTGQNPAWVQGVQIYWIGGVRLGVIGIALEDTPELVMAGNTAGLSFLPAVETIRSRSLALQRQGVLAQIVLIHEGALAGANKIADRPAEAWEGPAIDIAGAIQDTSVDAIFGGHTHRIANTIVGRIPVLQGLNAGASYSVAQLILRGREVEWVGGATRIAKNLGVPARADVQTVVDDADAATAVLRNAVIGTQIGDIRRDPARLAESAMGNLVADAMRSRYPGVDAALTNSGGLRQDILAVPPTAGEAPNQITWGEVFAVLPFGNKTVIETLTGAQLQAAFENGLSPTCDPGVPTGRSPQLSGLVVDFSCSGTSVVVNGIWLAPDGPGGALTPVGPADPVRLVTNDFMFTGGDGYTVLAGGADVQLPGDDLVTLAVDYIRANSPVGPVVEGRIVGP